MLIHCQYDDVVPPSIPDTEGSTVDYGADAQTLAPTMSRKQLRQQKQLELQSQEADRENEEARIILQMLRIKKGIKSCIYTTLQTDCDVCKQC